LEKRAILQKKRSYSNREQGEIGLFGDEPGETHLYLKKLAEEVVLSMEVGKSIQKEDRKGGKKLYFQL